MAAPTGTPPGGTSGTTGTSDGKPRATKVIDSTRDKPDAASAATTETSQPSAERILETNPASSAGSAGTSTPTPASITVTQSDTGKSSTATYLGSGSGPTGIGGVTEPSSPTPTAADQFSRPDSGSVSTSTINPASSTDAGPKGDTTGSTDTDTDTLTTAARDIGQQVGSRAGEEWRLRKQQVSEVAGSLRESASRTAEQVRRQSRQGVNTAQTVVTEHPLAAGMVALGVGLLVAGLLYSQNRRSSRPYYRDREVDFGEYPSNRTYDYRDEERDYRRAEGNAGYDRSGY